MDMHQENKKLLLHCCCGPCSTTCIKRLLAEGYEPVLWYGNDNIYPVQEFEKRYDNLKIVAAHHGLELIKGTYDHDAWLQAISGLEREREGGRRCEACFAYNLAIAAAKAKELDIPYFTTTLTVSRYKDSHKIFAVGENLEGFLAFDFKKKGGYEESIRLSKELGLYRQQYCGCEFSYAQAAEQKKKHNC
ncbi:MAG: epoxyqueuosine reductase QueH [Spirochaetia bacterium]|jgi:predicted adenine nucleotide alpha hydrolase (AANH) superfamily ATPase|nr:epoxyqueuosine reductase QueH [Spirochaetia bacterium]